LLRAVDAEIDIKHAERSKRRLINLVQ